MFARVFILPPGLCRNVEDGVRRASLQASQHHACALLGHHQVAYQLLEYSIRALTLKQDSMALVALDVRTFGGYANGERPEPFTTMHSSSLSWVPERIA